jgi:hypothetical protein
MSFPDDTTRDVTVNVPAEDARRLVALVGERDEQGRYVLFGTAYWQLDEALGVALRELAANDLGRA